MSHVDRDLANVMQAASRAAVAEEARAALDDRRWYYLGLALVQEHFTPPGIVDDALKRRLRRVVRMMDDGVAREQERHGKEGADK